jgi:hypothetical protein
VPIWEKTIRDGYLVLDEIAYMGECNTTLLESEEEDNTRWPKRKNDLKPKQVKAQLTSTISSLMTSTMESRPLTS